MLVRLHDLTREFSPFIIATHSPLRMAFPDAWIYHFDAEGVRRVAFEDTEHYRITRAFMMDHRSMVRRLLESDEQPPA